MLRCYPSANVKIEELDAKRQALSSEIADMTAKTMSATQMERISADLDNWEHVSFEDRRRILDGLVTTIRATSENVQIDWTI